MLKGEENGINFCGHSRIVNPLGNVIVECGEEEQVIITEIDTDLIKNARKRNLTSLIIDMTCTEYWRRWNENRDDNRQN